jgi:competence protein ComEC
MLKEKRQLWFSIILSLILLGLAFILIKEFSNWWPDFYQQKINRSQVDVYFLDVGQGDATLFYTDSREVILVDGGPSLSVLYALGQALPFYERTIDLLVLTHPDSDHINGLIEVVKRYKVKKVLYNGIVDDLAAYQVWQEQIKASGIEIIIAQAGQNFTYGNLDLEVFYPVENLFGRTFDDTNESSVVIKFSYYDIDFLLTGDLSAEKELELIDLAYDLSAEIMKAGHHGSKTSTHQKFLQTVKPQYVVISAGKDNSYGHPHFIVLQRLINSQAKILRTDERGDIRISTNGQNIEIK